LVVVFQVEALPRIVFFLHQSLRLPLSFLNISESSMYVCPGYRRLLKVRSFIFLAGRGYAEAEVKKAIVLLPFSRDPPPPIAARRSFLDSAGSRRLDSTATSAVFFCTFARIFSLSFRVFFWRFRKFCVDGAGAGPSNRRDPGLFPPFIQLGFPSSFAAEDARMEGNLPRMVPSDPSLFCG